MSSIYILFIYKNRLKQKDQTIQKYQEMIKLNREEMENLNKQHELEMINMYDKANLLNENNLKKLKQRLGTQFSDLPITSRAQVYSNYINEFLIFFLNKNSIIKNS